MPPVFVDARALAVRLDVSYQTILAWVRRRKIPYIRDGRRRLMFNLDSVLTALQPESTPDPVAGKAVKS